MKNLIGRTAIPFTLVVSVFLATALLVTACGSAGAGGGGGGNGGDDTVEDDDTPGEDDQPDDDGPAAGVRIQGRLGGLVEPSGIEGASLSSAAVNVAALPVTSEGLDVEATKTTEVSQEDGSFSVDVEPEDDSKHVFLVEAPEEGVGVEQSLGFLELPIEDEASAGWKLSETQESILDMGELSGSSGSFLAEESAPELLEALNVDQQELLFQAQRDDYLKASKNIYLNRDFNRVTLFTHLIAGQLSNARNDWTLPTDSHGSSHKVLVELRFDLDSDIDFDGIEAGTTTFEIVPPTDVTFDGGVPGSPSNPLQITNVVETTNTDDEGNPVPTGYELNFAVENGLPRGAGNWQAVVDGEVGATYDFELNDPFDADGKYLYFVPSVRLTVDENTEEITAVELRWFTWNPETQNYEAFDEVFDGHDWGADSTGVAIVYEQEGSISTETYGVAVGSPTSVPDAIYWSAPAGEKQLISMNLVSPFLGIATTYDFSFPLQPE